VSASQGSTPRRHGPAFASVVLDVDSTLSGVEGINWLAERRGGDVAAWIPRLTEKAMTGELSIAEVYAHRLQAVAPTRADLAALGDEYIRCAAPGARDAVASMQGAGVRVEMVSGGLLPAVQALGAWLGVPESQVHAVGITFSSDGAYEAFDAESPLATPMGKPELLRVLRLPRPLLAVGDGITDVVMRTDGEADAFVAFTAYTHREIIMTHADYVMSSFADVAELVLNGRAAR
jgi:phosphoserine phosphatase